MKSVIHAFQKILTTYRFDESELFPEDFAIKRYLKKMEIPDKAKVKLRKEACFDSWLNFDESLKLPVFLPSNWYKARLLIHEWCRDFRLDPVAFTNGSESTPTYGFNSIESKLSRSKWECSSDCFELWAKAAYETLAIKRATRQRFRATMLHDEYRIKNFHKESYAMYRNKRNFKFLCFVRMLSKVTFVREASRFSTVRKNNEVDRPIDIQPICNILVQRQIGNGFRSLLRKNGVDLNHLAEKHREMIKCREISTIDLKNASDSIHLNLVEFLFPKRVYSLIERSRMYFVESPNKDYIIPKKVSSMGNGFTFELMSVIIRSLGLQLDDNFSVFGDDIIIRNEVSDQLICDLTSVGFVVNVNKTFIRSRFRESCGGNYHDDHGYIESYDFEYPENIHDCVTINNKAFALGVKYPQFKKLSKLLLRTVPSALHGPAFLYENDGEQGYNQQINLSSTFWSSKMQGEKLTEPNLLSAIEDLDYDPSHFRLIKGFKFNPKLASRRLVHLSVKRQYGKYLMYLHAGRKTDDVVTGCGSWQMVAYVSDGNVLFRAKTLLRN